MAFVFAFVLGVGVDAAGSPIKVDARAHRAESGLGNAQLPIQFFQIAGALVLPGDVGLRLLLSCVRRAWFLMRSGRGYVRSGGPAIIELIPLLHPVQCTAAAVFLKTVGSPRVPSRLARLLTQYDLGFALGTFCRELGVDFGAIGKPRAGARHHALARLTRVLPLLQRIEDAAKDSALDSAPLYAALSGSSATTESLLNLYLRAEAVDRALGAARAEFPAFDDFRREVSALLRSWPRLSFNQLDEAYGVLCDFRAAQALLEDLRLDLDAAFAELAAHPNLGDLRLVVARMSADRVRLNRATISGAIMPSMALAELAALLEKAHVIVAHLGAHPSSPRPESSVDGWSSACKRLGLEPTATLKDIKRAYRRLAKQHHPDTSRTRANSVDDFRKITEAYRWLVAHASVDRRDT
jgi:DnaJ-domain-containing protein 1